MFQYFNIQQMNVLPHIKKTNCSIFNVCRQHNDSRMNTPYYDNCTTFNKFLTTSWKWDKRNVRSEVSGTL